MATLAVPRQRLTEAHASGDRTSVAVTSAMRASSWHLALVSYEGKNFTPL